MLGVTFLTVNVSNDSAIVELRKRLIQGMREFMQDAEVAYDESHIELCDAILVEFLNDISSATDRSSALHVVKEAVLKLNALNERCVGELIETDQREDICALMIRGGHLRGFNGVDEDTTEQWRDW